ncbi:MAG: VCBS repeat-containing protein [Acidobacteriota bacterium]|nr:VCBS repeat-containing protein [Acidobacteriota bacterium]
MKKILSMSIINPSQALGAKSVLFGILALLLCVPTLRAQSEDTDVAAKPSAGCPTAKRPLDFDGDGKTDPTVVRNTGGGPTGQVTWYSRNSTNGNLVGTTFGLASDFFVSGDFDGDGKSDITVWRPGTQAYYYILQSQTNTFRAEAFGVNGDDPTVVGDYDGDGKTDPAIYRAGANPGDKSIWAYRASTGAAAGQIVIVQWGQNGDFPAPGDFDGDGKYDFSVQRSNGNGQAAFYISQSTAGFTAFTFGTPTDVVVPGYYDNDCKTDIAVRRSSGGSIVWYIRNSTNGALQAYTFGTSATDSSTQGDYDGDGVTDIAVWRPSASAGGTAFYWRRSIDGALGVQQWGQSGDYPPANFNSH